MAASSDNDSYAWADDLVADDEWTDNCDEEMRKHEILQEIHWHINQLYV